MSVERFRSSGTTLVVLARRTRLNVPVDSQHLPEGIYDPI